MNTLTGLINLYKKIYKEQHTLCLIRKFGIDVCTKNKNYTSRLGNGLQNQGASDCRKKDTTDYL